MLIISKNTFLPQDNNNNITGGEKEMTLQDKMNTNAKPALKNLKTEIANELGLANYDTMEKGYRSARQNGYVCGYITNM